jgi:hypothetical protein
MGGSVAFWVVYADTTRSCEGLAVVLQAVVKKPLLNPTSPALNTHLVSADITSRVKEVR